MANLLLVGAADEIAAVRGDLHAAQLRLDAAQGDLRAAQGDLRAAQGDLRAAQGRLDAAQGRLDAAQGRLDAAQGDLRATNAEISALEKELKAAQGILTKSDRSFSLRGPTRADVANSITELNTKLVTKKQDKTNFEQSVQDATRARNDAKTAFDTARPGLEHSIAEAKAFVQTANARVQEAQSALELLQGVRAIDFLRKPLQEPLVSVKESELELRHIEPDQQPVTKVLKTSETSLKGRAFQHFMPKRIEKWLEFESRKEAWAEEIGDRIIPKPSEVPVENTFFDSEREFASYWLLPRQETWKATSTLAPHLPLRTAKFGSKKPKGTGITDEYMTVEQQSVPRGVEVTEYKHPGVRFHTEGSVADLAKLPPPSEGENGRGPEGNVLKSLIQTYTYMVSDKANAVKYGALSNWDFWLFFMRVVENGEEVVYVSQWYHRDHARLAWAYFITLAAAPQVDDNQRGETAPIPDWLLPKEKDHKDEDGDKDERGRPRRTSTGGGSGFTKKGLSGGPSAALEELYPDTTTAEALGVPALLWIQPFEMLSLSDKSHARRVKVNGRDLVAKIVDFYGTPGHTEWSQQDLYELEWNEVRAYHHLLALQGTVVPQFLYHGSDLNHLWATAVTSYEGVSLARIVNDGGQLPAGARTRTLDALRALHAAGLLHGDVALRNAVWRERDGAVLWVDFERAEIKGADVDEAEFGERALCEEKVALNMFKDVPMAPDIPIAPASPAAFSRARSDSPNEFEPWPPLTPTSAKRSKIFPTCCS